MTNKLPYLLSKATVSRDHTQGWENRLIQHIKNCLVDCIGLSFLAHLEKKTIYNDLMAIKSTMKISKHKLTKLET